MPFYIAAEENANLLLDQSPLALLIGMVLDQQIPMERAFSAPYLLQNRLGQPLDAQYIATMDPEKLQEIFSIKPALHRFPSAMAKRVAEVARLVAVDYNNDAGAIWNNATSPSDLFKRICDLPGFGIDKTKIFIALLGKQVGIKIDGWQEVCQPFGEEGTTISVADIIDDATFASVRQFKQEMKLAKKAKTDEV
ncbi:HhH-GPD-type base excision DNA repair protein [Acidithrix sp. C25]|uniref:HhH-GPD-type base excision DNA repair protein n=1 Tax=Acidithrix sp. C25 TaxID=1671482 RepID=UPI00191BB12B|nr:HhH-GPD-type base excision DNA repair protein [Acidithrix sp. C25]CAG4925194.1 unnamed protein product [Acidithrix sp. C25]